MSYRSRIAMGLVLSVFLCAAGLGAQQRPVEALRLDYTFTQAVSRNQSVISRRIVLVASSGKVRTEEVDPSSGTVRQVEIDDPHHHTVIVLDPAHKTAYQSRGVRGPMLPGSQMMPSLAKKRPAGTATVAGMSCQKFISASAVKSLPVEFTECRDSASGQLFVGSVRSLGFTGAAIAGSTQTLEKLSRVSVTPDLFKVPRGYRTIKK